MRKVLIIIMAVIIIAIILIILKINVTSVDIIINLFPFIPPYIPTIENTFFPVVEEEFKLYDGMFVWRTILLVSSPNPLPIHLHRHHHMKVKVKVDTM